MRALVAMFKRRPRERAAKWQPNAIPASLCGGVLTGEAGVQGFAVLVQPDDFGVDAAGSELGDEGIQTGHAELSQTWASVRWMTALGVGSA